MQERKLKVVMVVNGFPNHQDKYKSHFNLCAAKELSKIIDLTVIVPRAWIPGRPLLDISTYQGIPVVTAFVPQIPAWQKVNLLLYYLIAVNRLSKYFKSADIIHTVGIDFAGILGGIWSRKMNLHHVTQLIADSDFLKTPFTKYPFFSMLSDHLHAISCNSSELASKAKRIFPHISHIQPIYRGVDLERFSPNGSLNGPQKAGLSTKFSFFGGLPKYPERLHNRNTKGGETLMQAWQEAETVLTSFGATLLFGGPNARSSQALSWRESLLHPERVFLFNKIPYEDIPAHIRASDVVLIPSLEEGLPNLACEASACARPVFGSKVGGIPDVVSHGKTGLLLDPGSVDAWKNALAEYSNPNRIGTLRTMGTNARAQMELNFSHKRFSKNLLALYRKALEVPLKQSFYEL